MRKKIYLLIFLILPVFSICLLAAQKNYRVIGYEGDIYFGHITYLEPKNQGEPSVIKHWGSEEFTEAVLNFPLMPGDTVFSHDGRLELQFDNGTLLRLDRHSELFLQTVLAPTLSSNKKVSNIVLSKGAIYVMYKEYDSSELFQVLTNKSAVKLDHNSVSIIKAMEDGSSEVVVMNGRVWLMVPPNPNKKDPAQMKLEKGWRAIISAPLGEVQAEPYNQGDEFLSWNEEINANFAFYHEGSVLPKPLSNLPQAVYYFAQRYGSLYGEWIWHDLYGYVWRPFFNDYYPWGSWMPYIYGRWMNIGGSLFWIPEEPWGWVPYHLGFWMWDKNKGWIWIPGSVFAPAWAVWHFFYGYYAWRPWTLYDWYFATYYSPLGYNQALAEYYYRFARSQIPEIEINPVLNKIRKDQLKKASSSEKISPPREVKKITDIVLNSLKRGDPEAVESLRRSITSFVMLSKEDFKPDFPREKLLRFNEAIERGQINLSPSALAERPTFPQEIIKSSRTIERPAIITIKEVTEPVASLPGKKENLERITLTSESKVLPERIKTVDWNPDVRIAYRLGYDIIYDSQKNEVRCPQLGYGSRDLAFRRIMVPSPMGGFTMISNPFSPNMSSSSGGLGPSPTFTGGADRTGASSPGRESGGGRSGEKR